MNYKDRISIHLSQSDKPIAPNQHYIAISIFVYDVDSVYADFKEKGIEIHNPIGTRDYGMRDFDIKDPSGYLLTFGMYVGHESGSK